MKPLALTLTAFGPFGSTVVVDFERLAAHSLFLIHGPTGAGKTSILDGLCYALYGQTSGGERGARDLRSHHASGRVRTEVALTFQARGKSYRIRRAPEQERPKRRGSGVTVVKSEVELQVLASDADEHDAAPKNRQQGLLADEGDEFLTLATKATEVEERVVALLGLSAEQFRQVVVLPQGKFREFLLAPSRERQAILESLFHTERYRDIERVLHAQADAVADKVRDANQRRELILEQAEATDEGSLLERRRAVDDEAKALKEKTTVEQEKLADTQKILERARLSARVLAELAHAKEQDAGLAKEASRFAELDTRLEASRRAARVKAAVDAESEAQQAKSEADHRASTAEEEKARLTGLLTDAKGRLEEAEREHAGRADLESRMADLDDVMARLSDVVKAKEAVDEAKATVRARESQVKKATRNKDKVEARHTEYRRALDEAKLLGAAVENRRATYVQLLKVRQVAQRLDEVTTLREENAAALSMAKQRAGAEEELADLAQAARDRAEDAWLKDRAAHLATSLEDGAPCPVCGSPEHPAPATPRVKSQGVSERAVRERRKEFDQARSKLEASRVQLAQLEAKQEALSKERDMLTEQLGDKAGTDLDAEIDRAGARLEEAEVAFDGLEQLEAKVVKSDGEVAEASKAVEEAQRGLEDARLERERAAAVYKERRGSGGEADSTAIAKERTELEQALHRLVKAKQEAEHAVTAAANAASAADAVAKETAQAAKRAQEALSARGEALKAALAAHGFENKAQVLETALDEAEERRLAGEISDFQRRRHAAAERLRRAETEAEGREPANVDDLTAKALTSWTPPSPRCPWSG